MRVIIAGSREFKDYVLLKVRVMHMLANQTDVTIVCGEARGADALGKRLALELGWQVASYPADWDKYGKSAGYRRNELMADNADALIAFWDGASKGTKHMIDIATHKGLKVKVFNY